MKANTKIALPPIHIVETTKIVVEADYELTQTLARYADFYRDAYGAAVKPAELLREMARRFMATDRDFLSFGQKRRRRARKSVADKAPLLSQLQPPGTNGTGHGKPS